MKVRTSLTRGVVVALPALVLSGLLPSAGAAPTAPTTPSEGGPPPRMELVVDLSGSMKENDAGGQTRLAAAKQAVNRIIDTVPQDAEFGVRVYGATYPGKDTAQGCADTQQLFPVGKMDGNARTSAKNKVAGLNAVGFTPIGVSLRAAAQDLGPTGKRRIVLVSDGEDTCAPPQPCEVARELKAQGIDLAVDVIGFRTKPEVAAQLKCIADVTGGSFAHADNAEALTSNLSTMFRRAWTTYQATGTRITGSTDGCSDAPMVTPGQYLDALTRGKHTYYRVKKRPDEILQVSATAVGEEGYGRGSGLTVQAGPAGDGDPDDWLREYEQSMGWGNVISVGARSKADDKNAKPAPGDIGCIMIKNDITDGGDKPMPLELLVGLADTKKAGVPQNIPVKTGPDAAGGFSFNSATPIGPGTHRQSIAVGEAPFWRVDVKAGQELKITAGVEIPGDFPNGGTTGWSVTIYNAMRNEAKCNEDGGATKLFQRQTGRFAWICGPWQVTRPDPSRNSTDSTGYATPGTYYIQAQVAEPDAKAKGLIVPIDLTVELVGTPLSGSDPAFDFGPGAPPTTSADTGRTGGKNGQGSQESQDGRNIPGTTTSADGDESTVGKLALPAGIVAAVALLGGVGFYGLRRR